MLSPSPLPRFCLIILQLLRVKLTLGHIFSLGLSFSPHNFAILQVPIVKLIHQQCQIEADLSLYNVLARENTCLLSLYSGDLWMRICRFECKSLGSQDLIFCFQILTLEFGPSDTWSSFLQRSYTSQYQHISL